MIRSDKNDLMSLAVLLFLVAVYAHHQQNQLTLLACCACWPQCMIPVSVGARLMFVPVQQPFPVRRLRRVVSRSALYNLKSWPIKKLDLRMAMYKLSGELL